MNEYIDESIDFTMIRVCVFFIAVFYSLHESSRNNASIFHFL